MDFTKQAGQTDLVLNNRRQGNQVYDFGICNKGLGVNMKGLIQTTLIVLFSMPTFMWNILSQLR